MSTTSPHPPPPASNTCPACTARVGDRHDGSCPIYSEVIGQANRPQPYDAVLDSDITLTSCGCSTVLVRARDEHGHRNGCARAPWITGIEPPPDEALQRWEDQHPGALVAGWVAGYADHNDRRHVPDDAVAGGFHAVGPFRTWAQAAGWLDDLATNVRTARPLGVFTAIGPPVPVGAPELTWPVLTDDPARHGVRCPDCLHPWWSHPRLGNQHGTDHCIGTACRCPRRSAPSGMTEAVPARPPAGQPAPGDCSLRCAVRDALREGSQHSAGNGVTAGQVSVMVWQRCQGWGPATTWWASLEHSREPIIAELHAAVADEVATYQPPKANRQPRWLWIEPPDDGPR